MLHLSYTKHPKHSSAIRTNGSQHLLGALPTLSRTCEYRLMCTLSLHSNYSISSIVFNNSISSTVLFSGYACPTRGEDENDRLTTQSKPPLAVRILFSGRPGEGGYTWGGGVFGMQPPALPLASTAGRRSLGPAQQPAVGWWRATAVCGWLCAGNGHRR